SSSGTLRALHSFPTRRSSDLGSVPGARTARRRRGPARPRKSGAAPGRPHHEAKPVAASSPHQTLALQLGEARLHPVERLLRRGPGDQLLEALVERGRGLEAQLGARPRGVADAMPDVAGAVAPDGLRLDAGPEPSGERLRDLEDRDGPARADVELAHDARLRLQRAHHRLRDVRDVDEVAALVAVLED